MSKRLDNTTGLTGPDVARTLWDVLDSSALLLAASSWPVRHLESFARVRDGDESPQVIGNRGTAGIDGLIFEAQHHGQHFRSTYLPQVWEQIPEPRAFLAHLGCAVQPQSTAAFHLLA